MLQAPLGAADRRACLRGALLPSCRYWLGISNALAQRPSPRALALGYGSLYNSANPSNMRFEADASQLALRFIANQDIDVDEELTINYDGEGGAEWQDHNWFVENRIEFQP